MKVSNKNARSYVQNMQEFTGSNTRGTWLTNNDDRRYVVYSYGEHWPLFIYIARTDQWLENSDKYSTTTSKHHSQLHPHVETIKKPAEDMVEIAKHGAVQFMHNTLANAA